ncbi:hypothetical protein SH584_11515 [Sphingomonas sp. LY29]|uniref:hypothetical protein n=1 Tax=Sphingomonas sp. LY29 TaxID=3095341 RepID=UPI002D788B9C|nr:hypothetical protein [Sphingomonas sp. LY29]WRP25660.1 hypothetical protein SH584_11515 [Sphingomonas sp. LY29]
MRELGMALAQMLGQTGQAAPQAPAPGPKGPSKGAMILGILGDALAGAAGRGPTFGPMIARQRQEEQDAMKAEANWGRRLTQYEQQKQIDQRYSMPDVSPIERDLAVWERLSPEQRTAYQSMKAMGAPDPDVAVTLPDGRFYAGPRSGLAAALQGGGAAPAPQAPVGKLRPMNGGPASQAPGGFR